MTKVGDYFVRFCDSLNALPAASLCVVLVILQAACLDYFMITNLSVYHLGWIAPDVLNTALLICCISVSFNALREGALNLEKQHSFAWSSWFFINVSVSAKMIILFNEVAAALDEADPSFFGPNILKTSIALGSAIFMLLLITQHDAPLCSRRRLYIEELTGTVVFDVLDTVDILEILFSGDKTEAFWNGLQEFILAVAAMNLLIPTIPLLILSKTNFGHNKLQKHLIYTHRLLVVLAVNVPNLLVRFIVWHGFSGAISPFSLKNIILIGITLYEFYLHKREKYEKHEAEGGKSEKTNDEDKEEKRENISGESNLEGTNDVNGNCIDEGFELEARIETVM